MIDIVGEKYGELIVLNEVERDKNNKRQFLCKCSCGNEKIVRMNDLRSGKVLSCGCLGKKNRAKAKKISQNGIPKKDFINKKIGMLTILSLNESLSQEKQGCYWNCQCDCGKIVVKSTAYLIDKRLKNEKNCGCLNHISAQELCRKAQEKYIEQKKLQLENKRFGKLTVLSENKEKTKEEKHSYWNCICDCGNKVVIKGTILTSGESQSCGCLGQSKGEYYISELLKKEKINFKREITFSDLKDKGFLRFDFGIYDKNNLLLFLIEYDGRQHIDKTSVWHTESVEKHDKMKNEWCLKNNIPLIRIPYWHLEQLTFNDLTLDSSPFIMKEL